MQKILAWTCFGCTVIFAAVSLTAVFAGEASGVGMATLLYVAVALAVIGILTAIALVVVGRVD